MPEVAAIVHVLVIFVAISAPSNDERRAGWHRRSRGSSAARSVDDQFWGSNTNGNE